MPFYPSITNKLKDIFRRHNIDVVHNSSFNLKQLICNMKDKSKDFEQSGIYSVPCTDCNFNYIGQTRRSIQTRVNEHLQLAKNKKPDKSGVADHAIEFSHKINPGGAKKLKTVLKPWKLDAWESVVHPKL